MALHDEEKRGLKILGAPCFVVNPRYRMTEERYKLAKRCRWPAPWWHRAAQVIVVILALLIALALARQVRLL